MLLLLIDRNEFVLKMAIPCWFFTTGSCDRRDISMITHSLSPYKRSKTSKKKPDLRTKESPKANQQKYLLFKVTFFCTLAMHLIWKCNFKCLFCWKNYLLSTHWRLFNNCNYDPSIIRAEQCNLPIILPHNNKSDISCDVQNKWASLFRATEWNEYLQQIWISPDEIFAVWTVKAVMFHDRRKLTSVVRV